MPEDYKAFISRYGVGCIASFIWIFSPFADNPNVNLLVQKERQLSALRVLKSEFGEHLPYPLFPEADGLLPFAATDNGDVLHWLTAGSPEAWHVVVNDARSPQYDVHACGMTTFLAGILAGSRRSVIFPNELSFSAPFRPA